MLLFCNINHINPINNRAIAYLRRCLQATSRDKAEFGGIKGKANIAVPQKQAPEILCQRNTSSKTPFMILENFTQTVVNDGWFDFAKETKSTISFLLYYHAGLQECNFWTNRFAFKQIITI